MMYKFIACTSVINFVKVCALLDSSGNLIEPVSATPSEGQALFDEQQEVPERSSFRNGTYFDETGSKGCPKNQVRQILSLKVLCRLLKV